MVCCIEHNLTCIQQSDEGQQYRKRLFAYYDETKYLV